MKEETESIRKNIEGLIAKEEENVKTNSTY